MHNFNRVIIWMYFVRWLHNGATFLALSLRIRSIDLDFSCANKNVEREYYFQSVRWCEVHIFLLVCCMEKGIMNHNNNNNNENKLENGAFEIHFEQHDIKRLCRVVACCPFNALPVTGHENVSTLCTWLWNVCENCVKFRCLFFLSDTYIFFWLKSLQLHCL